MKWFEILGNYSDFVSTDMFTVTTCRKHTGIVVFSVHSILSVGSHSLSSFVCPASLLCSLSSLLFHLSLSFPLPFLLSSFILSSIRSPLSSYSFPHSSFLLSSSVVHLSSHTAENGSDRERAPTMDHSGTRERRKKRECDVFGLPCSHTGERSEQRLRCRRRDRL